MAVSVLLACCVVALLHHCVPEQLERSKVAVHIRVRVVQRIALTPSATYRNATQRMIAQDVAEDTGNHKHHIASLDESLLTSHQLSRSHATQACSSSIPESKTQARRIADHPVHRPRNSPPHPSSGLISHGVYRQQWRRRARQRATPNHAPRRSCTRANTATREAAGRPVAASSRPKPSPERLSSPVLEQVERAGRRRRSRSRRCLCPSRLQQQTRPNHVRRLRRSARRTRRRLGA